MYNVFCDSEAALSSLGKYYLMFIWVMRAWILKSLYKQGEFAFMRQIVSNEKMGSG